MCLLFSLKKRCSDMAFMPLVSFCCGPYVIVNMELPSGICYFGVFLTLLTNAANNLFFQIEGMDFLLIDRAWNRTTCRPYYQLYEQDPNT